MRQRSPVASQFRGSPAGSGTLRATNRKSLTALQLLALSDVSVLVWFGVGIFWHLTSRSFPLWAELLVLSLAGLVQWRYHRRFFALTRLARRVARSMPLPQRRTRYRWICAQFFAFALIVAWILPFGFSTAAFWCLYITALVVLVVLLEATRQELFGVA